MGCGTTFKMPQNEILWYKRKRFKLPCHCLACRIENRQEKRAKEKRIRKYA